MAASEVKSRVHNKRVSANSGKSQSHENPTGLRRKSGGKDLAPKSLRRAGKKFLSECTEQELSKLGM